jgi:ribose 5-phosphate isomerase A
VSAQHDGPLGLREMKRNAALAALDFVEAGKVIGVGSGSTVWCFIDVLSESGIRVAGAVAASQESARRLSAVGVEIVGLADCTPTLYIDGADEIDMSGRAIKGGGAAHTREKLLASASQYWACIVDATKVVRALGGVPIPLEVAAEALSSVAAAVAGLGGAATLRAGIRTDAGNPILDATGLDLRNPLALEEALDAIPGVVGNGMFARRAADVILVGRATGGVGRIVPHRDGLTP